MEKDDKGSTMIRMGGSDYEPVPTRVVPDQRALNGRLNGRSQCRIDYEPVQMFIM